MNVFKSTIKYIAISVGIIIIALLLAAEFAEDPITKLALNKINESFGSDMSIEDIDLSFIKDFPNAQLELKNVILKNSADPNKEIMTIKQLYVGMKLVPLMDNRFEVDEITLKDGVANYKVFKDGTSNIDFLLTTDTVASQDTSTTHLWLKAPKINTSGITVNYSDEKENIKGSLILDAVSSIFIKDTISTTADVEGKITIKDVNYPETKANLMNSTNVDVHLIYTDNKLNIKRLKLSSDGLEMDADGQMELIDNYPANINVSNATIQLGELAKYIPDSLISEYNIKDLNGDLNFNATIQGDLMDTTLLPSIKANALLKNFSVAALNYPKIEQLNTELSYDNGAYRELMSTTVTIKSLLLKTPKSQINIKGQATNLDIPTYAVQSDLDLDLNEFKPFIPNDLKLKLAGKVKGSITNNGTLPKIYDLKTIEPLIDATKADLTFTDFNCQMDSVIDLQNFNGNATFSDKTIELQQITAHLPEYKMNIKPSSIQLKYIGSINNIDHLAVQMESFNINANNSQLSGKAYFQNAKRPSYKIDAQTKVELSDWSAFIPDTLLSEYSGQIKANLQSAGSVNLDSIADDAMRIFFEKSNLSLNTQDLNVKTADGLMSLNNLNTSISFNQDSISLSSLSGAFNDISFNADSTYVTNVYKGVLLNKGTQIKMFGDFHLGTIDVNKVMALFPSDTTKTESDSETESEPMNLKFDVKGRFKVDKVIYDKAVFNNISGLYKLTESEYIVDQLKIDAFKGQTNTSVKVQVDSDDVMKINFKNSTHNLDINQLLADFDDFKEYGNDDYISHDQLTGTFSTENLNGYILFKDSLITDSVKMSADLKLENGRLTNYPIAVEMGEDYGIDDLEDLQFQTLDTKLFVYQSAVYVPKTDIKTNTFDITILGMQEFDLDCQYHLRFYLKEILRKGKTDRIERKQAQDKKADGTTKGLTSLYAIYKVEDGETVKSFLEGKDSDDKRKMQRIINLKKTMLDLIFFPTVVSYDTNIEE